ncbi:hypothetical protein D7X33_29475 [Butyricicoccus sp. 1XD8-22]|nr:hypothetical protein D7X33_29475 [Butyricicoccus sp. 1XD8-22]
MFIQVELKLPIHWQIKTIEINEITVRKDGQLIQFEANETANPSFYEKVCSQFKKITWNGVGVDPAKFYVNDESQTTINKDQFNGYVIKLLHESVLTDIIIDLQLFNEEEVQPDDLVVSQITLKDPMLRRSICEVEVRHFSIAN